MSTAAVCWRCVCEILSIKVSLAPSNRQVLRVVEKSRKTIKGGGKNNVKSRLFRESRLARELFEIITETFFDAVYNCYTFKQLSKNSYRKKKLSSISILSEKQKDI